MRGLQLTSGEGSRDGSTLRIFSVPAVNPLQIPTAFIFASIFVVISVVTAWIRVTFGQTGVLIMAAAIGATDIDPFVINIAQGGVTGLSATMLSTAVLIAASSNNIAKAIYAIAFGGAELFASCSLDAGRFGHTRICCCSCLHPAVGTVLNVQSNKFIGLKDAHVKPSNKGLKPDRLDFD